MDALAGVGSPPLPPSKSSKGKDKMDSEAEEAQGAEKMCGICYIDGSRAIRGELDCCAHYFCFVCIMAWGRVESRCPFCKARFTTIRRPPVPGRFPHQRIVSVPERNQVYHPQGNVSSTVGADPYANTICTVCSCTKDDELLLLCELCDSAAHTYCAGLGNTVPERDWFCKDCAAVRQDNLRWQAENQGESEISIDVPRDEPIAAPSVFGAVVGGECDLDRADVQSGRRSADGPVPSIYDIVGEDFVTRAGIFRRPRRNTEDLGSQSVGLPQVRNNGLEAYHARIRLEVERTRTLRNSRNLDKRIRELRENWAALRDGSVGFAPHGLNRRRNGTPGSISVDSEHWRYMTPVTISNKNGGASSSVQQPTAFSKETSTSASLGNSKKVLHKDTRDARKAWKRLELAKSSGGSKTSNKTDSLNCSRPFSMGNRSTSYSPIDAILGHKNRNLPNEVCQQNNANCGYGAKMESTPPTNNFGGCRSFPENSRASVHERMVSFQNRIDQESLNGKAASSIHNQHVDKSCSTHKPEKLKSDMMQPLKCSLFSGQSAVAPPSLQLGPTVGSQSTMMLNPDESSVVCVEGGSAATIEVRKSSRPDRHERKRKHTSEKCHDEGSKRSKSISKIAKSEISLLAVRELKLLKIDKTHGSDRFKEVARTVTHSILAACGFEHSPSQCLALSRPVCKHSPKVKPLNSSAITDSCRECLRNFVKDAVSLALNGRQMDQTCASS
ncbi:hypothetical protein U9M48_028926 [Paspalum notatum var. saurae]|uniref:Uncharacterized protein n=1 Tax=Paspalum notatum var. saurae TaxID=547442 RepID=A0AAQ3TXD9_PASNO